jgi:hypothetical protein
MEIKRVDVKKNPKLFKNFKLILFGLLLYGLVDRLIPYNSPTPLIAIGSIGVLLPLAIIQLTRNLTSIFHTSIILIIFVVLVKLFFIYGPNGANYSDGKTSISYGTYIGLSPLVVNIRLLFILILVTLFAIYFAWFAMREKSKVKDSTRALDAPEIPNTKIASLQIWFVLASVAICTPFLEGQIQALTQVVSPLDFDSQQINAWFDFKSQGFTEMKDFWFPYGGMIWVQDGLLGIVLRWALLSVLIIMLLNYFLVGKRSYRQQSAYLTVAVLLIINYPIISIRYVFPLIALLVFFNLKKVESRKTKLTKSLPLAISIWLSPEMALFVIGLSSFGLILKRFNRMDESYDKSFQIWTFPIISFLVLISTQFQSGQLANTVHLLLHSREILEYGFSPFLAFQFDFSVDYLTLFRLSIVALSLMVLIRSTSYFLVSALDSQLTSYALNNFFTGLYLLFLIQKEMSRGGMTLWVAILIGLSISLLLEIQDKVVLIHKFNTKLHETARETLGVLSVLTILIVLFATPVGAGTFTTILRAPQQAKVFLNDIFNFEIDEVLLHSAWMKEDQKSLEKLKIQFGPFFQDLLSDTPYILGDRPDIYRALGKKPYWAISQYNLSPKSAQEKVLAQIKERNPKFVLVDRNVSAQNFDNVPSSLRNPIIYRHIVENYSFLGTFGDIDLYERSGKIEDLIGWRNLLGGSLDVSALPLIVSKPSACSDLSDANCKEYLKFRLGGIGNLKLDFNCSGMRYSLTSSSHLLKPGVDYWFPLNNVWFWDTTCNIEQNAAGIAEVLRLNQNDELY